MWWPHFIQCAGQQSAETTTVFHAVQVSSFGENPLLQPAAARLANAMVAVLGPEFTLGSAAYSRCKTLVTDSSGGISRVPGTAGGGGCGVASTDGLRGLAATWAELEQVLFAQQLILFAPQAVPAAKHLPLLLATLTSSRPALRRAAAATLKHLAERNPLGLAEVGQQVAQVVYQVLFFVQRANKG